jgi:hypothetical protein
VCSQAEVGRQRESETREFETYVGDLEALRDWLVAERVMHVAMEATGSTGSRSGSCSKRPACSCCW